MLQFDKNWNPVRKTCTKAATLFSEPNGILVDTDYIYVCSNKNDHICVLDHSLTVCYTIRLSFSPIDITKFDGKFFVSTNAAIVMLDDVNFSAKTLRELKFDKMTRNGSELVLFRRCELRGICASDKYLYVTEKHRCGRLLCLEFHNNHLKYISEIPNCAPNAVAYSDGSVYYSQGVYEEKFCIMKVTGQQSLTETKIMDV